MYALSVTSRPEKASVPARVKPVPENTRPGAHKWAVQVAALAEEKDAVVMMNSLRKNGYDAYVMTIQAENKTWHRVRVGRFADLQAAHQMKNSLTGSSEFKRAFVAAS
jgi:cell division septation protein DedD